MTVEAVSLQGGVSCEVVVVRENGRDIVIKQPLAKLKVIADWRSNPDRFEVEARALTVVRELLGSAAAPEVLWVDSANRRFAMERIDSRLRNWKVDLLSGRVDLVTAQSVGELLGLLHTRSSKRPDIAKGFANTVYFEELRIEPFFERVAKVNPSLATGIRKAIADLRQPGIALIHGDFSPKNLLVDGAEVVILDLEIAHFGNPRFDVAFCLSHLILKGMRRNVDASAYFGAAREFLRSYESTGFGIADDSLTRILGCLLLARFDGASPVDYKQLIDEPRVRALAEKSIQAPARADAVLDRLLAG